MARYDRLNNEFAPYNPLQPVRTSVPLESAQTDVALRPDFFNQQTGIK
jgi:hypothetical protein